MTESEAYQTLTTSEKTLREMSAAKRVQISRKSCLMTSDTINPVTECVPSLLDLRAVILSAVPGVIRRPHHTHTHTNTHTHTLECRRVIRGAAIKDELWIYSSMLTSPALIRLPINQKISALGELYRRAGDR